MKEQAESYRTFDYQPVFRHPSSKKTVSLESVPCPEPEIQIAEVKIANILEELTVSQDTSEMKPYDGFHQRMEDLNDLIQSIEQSQNEKEKTTIFEGRNEENPVFSDSLQSFEKDIDALIQEVSVGIPAMDPLPLQTSIPTVTKTPSDKKAMVAAIAIPEMKKSGFEDKKATAFHYDNPNVITPQPSQKQKDADAQIVQQFDYPALHYLHTHKRLGFSLFPISVLIAFGAWIAYAFFILHFPFQIAFRFGLEQWMFVLIIGLVFTYLTLSIHTGSFLLRNIFGKWPRSMLILCSPLLAILFLLPGVLCEIPYVIFTILKHRKEKP